MTPTNPTDDSRPGRPPAPPAEPVPATNGAPGTIRRPAVRLLTDDETESIVEDALAVLEAVGVFVESKEGSEILLARGAARRRDDRIAIPERAVREALASAPRRVVLYDTAGNSALDLEGDNVHYDPGSAAIHLIEGETRRLAVTKDVVSMVRLVEHSACYAAQSTALISSDVPAEVADRYRLYLALRFGRKPVVTGTFRKDGFAPMLDLLLAVRGSAEALAKKPLAVFDCCPSPPLAWSDLTCQALIDCARARIPATIVSMPLAGATAPVTLRESVVQHCAEALSGIVLHQSACPGAPILYGGAPAAFDMRRGTAAMGAMETMMIGIAYAQVGKRLGLPTHGYLVVSDGKVCDYQAGLESGIGAVLGALAGINLISGAGMLDYLLSQSLEKLLLDADAIAMAQRLVRGIARVPCDPVELMRELTAAGSALSMPHTREHHRRELAVSSGLVDRDSYGDWTAHGRRTAEDRAAAEARRLLSRRDAAAEIRSDRFPGLDEIMQGELSRYGSTSDLRTLLGDLMEDAR